MSLKSLVIFAFSFAVRIILVIDHPDASIIKQKPNSIDFILTVFDLADGDRLMYANGQTNPGRLFSREGRGSRQVKGVCLILKQFVALLIKRFHHSTRSGKDFLAQVSSGLQTFGYVFYRCHEHYSVLYLRLCCRRVLFWFLWCSRWLFLRLENIPVWPWARGCTADNSHSSGITFRYYNI